VIGSVLTLIKRRRERRHSLSGFQVEGGRLPKTCSLTWGSLEDNATSEGWVWWATWEFGGLGRAMQVAPGSHQIRIALPGYATFQTDINPLPRQKVEVKTDLVKSEVPISRAATERRDEQHPAGFRGARCGRPTALKLRRFVGVSGHEGKAGARSRNPNAGGSENDRPCTRMSWLGKIFPLPSQEVVASEGTAGIT
jgi:PEGA domain-containing protein